LFILDGKDKETVLQRFKAVDTSKTSEFKGIIANKGKITAKVRVIVPELDQKYELFVKKLLGMEMYQGEILVTETTSPDFVPLMKKAGGIIANQGGLNSHAAIMSRELKVPCLVGTYVATDILKTGDTVELDADNGIVRIIQRA
jgi:phosphoenolpyruvate synthase/pyruvate phosphate dikinase